jgi:hypothetical protein
MSKAIIILGNGFDLDLGLKTSYADFAKSPEWNNLMEGNDNSKDKSRLLGFLKSKYEVEKWIDIEAALLEFASKKTSTRDFAHAKEDNEAYVALCRALKDYLLGQQSTFTKTKNSVAYSLLSVISRLSNQSCLYSFNYTQVDVLASKCNIPMGFDATHIHGSLAENGDIILGIETMDPIDERYAFLYKTQSRHYKHTNIIRDLNNKDEYVFFGHSLNGMDFAYFNSIFSLLANSSLSLPHITIITKDVNAENQFKNFLRKEYISLQALYSNTDPVFILTDEIYRNNQEEKNKVYYLLNRARTF